jgi:hypothetical protein
MRSFNDNSFQRIAQALRVESALTSGWSNAETESVAAWMESDPSWGDFAKGFGSGSADVLAEALEEQQGALLFGTQGSFRQQMEDILAKTNWPEIAEHLLGVGDQALRAASLRRLWAQIQCASSR